MSNEESCSHMWEYFLAVAGNTGASKLRYCVICNTAELLFKKEGE